MKNTTFFLRSEEEKSSKLTNMLRQKTNNQLADEQLRQLRLSVHLGRQYTVYVHTNPQEFSERIVLVKSGKDNDYGSVVFGQALFGLATDTGYQVGQLFDSAQAACAIIVRKRGEQNLASYSNEIHIYIPIQCYRKGMQYTNGQKQKAAYRT